MQARYYDPVIGRFYSNDPVGFTGDITSFNRYSYVGNNPYKYTDPDGRSRRPKLPKEVRRDNVVSQAVGEAIVEVLPDGPVKDFVQKGVDGLKVLNKKPGSSNGSRAGKKHTKGAIKEAKRQNAEQNGGVVKCETCGVETTPGTRRTRGSTVNPNEGQGDHIQARSKGGNGATVKDQSNIDIKCAACNNKKSDN
ncbi:RHS repeat-associated core domain-containing protein [Pseudoalteromonas arctica]|uniref:RHS repeat-associated core domain-containing protein n=1 Tax=Pseudoalteromonas arctica TaxID=394751 RepID=A0A7Y0HD74_9GAMM|nr:RHS repeat-associated core domain-containing protein [Pseudoalteromonas arctica]NMM42158.1 RHS repeat-associated core domain-containing protein [Pseudoalteromonas arctica]